MQTAQSHNGISIRLTPERWQHIIHNHPEMLDQDDKVLQTLNNPDRIQAGDSGEILALRCYDKTPVTTDKFLVVAYRETSPSDGFVITAYFARRPSTRRKPLWMRPNS
ncbi:MAG: hypothetical protein WBD47_04455 [Phormidesmis sp.]